MKECFKCKKNYPLDFFKWRNKKGGIKFSYCNRCMIDYRHLHYLSHKSYYIEKAHVRNQIIKSERAKFVINYFSSHPCVDCGNSNPIVLEFDHRDGKNKEFNVSSILYSGSINKIMKEIDKCEVRCANCHKIKTAYEKKWQKTIHQNL